MGDTLGRYQLLVPIGQGGMAEVFLGRLRGAAGFAKLVVIKRMHTHLSHDKRFIELFVNEGRVVAQMSHPNICQVHELGEADGDLFLAMEYLSGVPLEEVLRVLPRGTAHELPLVAGILGQACEGLHYAHQLRDRMGNPTPVIHRDVSPQNLFVTTDGVCKVLDFGVAKVSTADRFTQSGMIKGKLPYMAPEQIRGQRVDARTDVFAMGIVLWEALTGSRLFSRPSDYLIWKAITEEPIPALAQLRPDLPPEIEAVVRRALQREPEQRYQTIQALGQELRRVARPAAYDAPIIAEALRALCAERLAETTTIVDRALHHLDRPTAEREAVEAADDPSAAETLHSSVMPSVMLREESVIKSSATGRKRRARRWPLILTGALTLAALATTLLVLRRPAPARATSPASAPAALDPPATTPLGPEPATGARAAGTTAAAPADAEPPAGAEPRDDASPAPEPERSSRHSSRHKATGASTSKPPAPPPQDLPGGATAQTEPAAPPRAESLPAQGGTYSVDSRPYATIYIDGVARGETPLFRVPLTAGSHQVRAVRADGTVQTFSITIPPGKAVSSGQLKW